MPFAQYKPAFDRDGFVVVRGFLPPAEFQVLTTNLDRYIREVVPTLKDAHAFYDQKGDPETLKQMQHMGCDPYFRDYTAHPTWISMAEALLGERVVAQQPEWFNKPPGVIHPTPPHQDNYYFNLKPPSVVTIWLALDRVDEENGCLRYVPGSHLRGTRPHGPSRVLGFSQGITDYGPDDEAAERQIHLQPGDAVVHHGNTIHRADSNQTSVRNRRAFAMVLRGASCRRDEEGYARYAKLVETQHEQMGLKA